MQKTIHIYQASPAIATITNTSSINVEPYKIYRP